MPDNQPRASAGFTLLEVLVSMIILAVGMLGVAALQGRAFQDNHDAYLYTQAVFQATDLSDRIRANGVFWHDQVTNNTVSGAATLAAVKNAAAADSEADHDYCSSDDPPSGGTLGCTPAELAAYDLYRWNTDTDGLLPGLAWTLTQITDPNDATRKLLRINLSWDVSASYADVNMNRPSYTLDVRPWNN